MKQNIPESSDKPDSDSPRSWPRRYALVLGELAVLIILFYVFTKVFE